MEKEQILIAKDNFIANGEVWLTKGKEYPLIRQSSEYVFVKRDDGIEDGFDLIKNFDIKPAPSIEFKKGDRVYWNELEGEVVDKLRDDFPIHVKFKNGFEEEFTIDGRLFEDGPRVLTFKPQQLDYSRPQWQPKEGEICFFWDVVNEPINCAVRRFKEMRDGKYLTTFGGFLWQFCAPCPVEALPPHLKGWSK